MNRFFSIASSALITTGLAILPVASFAQGAIGSEPAKTPVTQTTPSATVAPTTMAPTTTAAKPTQAPVASGKTATTAPTDKTAKSDVKTQTPGAKTEQHSQGKTPAIHHAAVKTHTTVPAVSKS
jgi:hypothetical protein